MKTDQDSLRLEDYTYWDWVKFTAYKLAQNYKQMPDAGGNVAKKVVALVSSIAELCVTIVGPFLALFAPLLAPLVRRTYIQQKNLTERLMSAQRKEFFDRACRCRKRTGEE